MNQAETTFPLFPSLALGAPIAERIVLGRLEGLRGGQLELQSGGRIRRFGQPAPDGLFARITVLEPEVFPRILFGGSVAAAEAFMDGAWVADDLTRALRLFGRDVGVSVRFEAGASRAGALLSRLYAVTRPNSRKGSRRNIADHYDLGNDFFQRMLDPTMTYSAALFDQPGSTLEQASLRKIDRLLERLDLQPTDHLLEIGTGWGSLAIRAASRFGCRVTTATISRAQRELAIERIAALGLAGQVTVLDTDYRDLRPDAPGGPAAGRYDKVVSCEMIEAIGREQFGTFFSRCAALLVPGGRLALQAITIRDQEFERASREVDFIKRYIFPGGCVPSATALVGAATAHSDLVLRGFEDLTPHYARTLAEWRKNLAPYEGWVVGRYGERFWRMWSYYLSYCEAGFLERYTGCAQLLFDRPRLP